MSEFCETCMRCPVGLDLDSIVARAEAHTQLWCQSVADVPALVSEVKALRAEVERLVAR